MAVYGSPFLQQRLPIDVTNLMWQIVKRATHEKNRRNIATHIKVVLSTLTTGSSVNMLIDIHDTPHITTSE